MTKKLKNILLTFMSLGLLVAPALAPVAVYAATTPNIASNLCSGSNLDLTGGSTQCDSGADQGKFQGVLTKVVNVFSIVVGVVAVIMIIVGGFRYITSGGSETNVSGAKSTIIYAIVGLIIVAVAQFIVHFVISNVSKGITGS